MRVVVGLALIVRASSRLLSHASDDVTIPAILLIAAGILLVIGLWTPIAGVLSALTEVWKIVMLPGDKWVWLLLGTIGAALAMLGPGVWSIDARLYGWKRLEPTPRKSSLTSGKKSSKESAPFAQK